MKPAFIKFLTVTWGVIMALGFIMAICGLILVMSLDISTLMGATIPTTAIDKAKSIIYYACALLSTGALIFIFKRRINERTN